jgi:hypothetical protein
LESTYNYDQNFVQKNNKVNKEAINLDKIGPLMGGSLLLGGGVASAVALYKLMNRLNENRRKEESTSYDDDTLYLTLPQPEEEEQKSASSVDESSTTGPSDVLVGGLGAILSAYLGYKGVDSIYNSIRQNRLQSELDEAQNIYLKRLQQTKTAGVKTAFGSNLDRMGAATLAVPLLIALGTGLVTNRILDKGSPSIKNKKTKTNLRKIVIKTKKPKKSKKKKIEKKDVKEELPVEPVALPGKTPQLPTEDVSPSDVENLIHLSLAKQSKDSGLNDLINKVASDGVESIKNNFIDFGLFTTFDMVKNSSSMDKESRARAIKVLSNDSILQDSVALYVASEYYDMTPTLCKNARTISNLDADALVDFSRESLLDVGRTKKAVAGTLLTHYLNKELSSSKEDEEEDQSHDRGLQLGASEDSESLKSPDEPPTQIDGVHVDAADGNAEDFLNKYQDIIDAALDVK